MSTMTTAAVDAANAERRAAPIYSMTGFASAQGTAEDGTGFTLTFKSVNHRFLDLNLRLPSDADAIEVALRRLFKERVRRGHVDVTLYVERRQREVSQTVQLNRDLLSAQVRLFREVAELHGLSAQPDVHELLRVPGVVSAEVAVVDSGRAPAMEAAVVAMAPGLLEQFNAVRAAEGAALATELRDSMLRLRELAQQATEIRSGAREAHLQRLRTRLAELLAGIGAADRQGQEGQQGAQVPDQRLLAEAAMLAERSDVEEELVRLRAHVDSFLEMLAAGGELGKRLDFLLQELNREANTMLSKTTAGDPALGLRLTTIGLEMKTEIERAREQVQNLE